MLYTLVTINFPEATKHPDERFLTMEDLIFHANALADDIGTAWVSLVITVLPN